MTTRTGLDVLCEQNFVPLLGKRIGVLCNQASIDHQLRHILDLLLPLHQQQKLNIGAIFGPQHGLWGNTQDNMIEWEGGFDRPDGIPIFSLYGRHRKPTPEMLNHLDLLLVDLQDVGARYYTFVWTMALCLQACREKRIEVWVLDRPNPINGCDMEGTVLDSAFSSFVGLYPLPQRHGMTIGEIACYLKEKFFPGLSLRVVEMNGWRREMFFPDTGLPWVMPSPNMPSWETALVYPGMCLLEGTNLSEGRGTTRPFEQFGAPWIDERELTRHLNNLNLPGVYFRPVQFQPTFQKFAGKLCRGAFIHVLDSSLFCPVITVLSILYTILQNHQEHFGWKEPPYEYEYEKLPFDILAGNAWLREMLEEGKALDGIEKNISSELASFGPIRDQFLIYS